VSSTGLFVTAPFRGVPGRGIARFAGDVLAARVWALDAIARASLGLRRVFPIAYYIVGAPPVGISARAPRLTAGGADHVAATGGRGGVGSEEEAGSGRCRPGE
jgi:hypothetical protein